MGPRLAGVGRLVDAVARHDVAADARLARADEDDVGLRFRDGDGADRRAPDLAVGDGRPFRAAVDRLPQSAAGRAEVAFSRPPLHAGDGDRSAAAVRADAAPFEGGHDGLIEDVLAARRLRGEAHADIPSGGQRQQRGAAKKGTVSGQSGHGAQPPRKERSLALRIPRPRGTVFRRSLAKGTLRRNGG